MLEYPYRRRAPYLLAMAVLAAFLMIGMAYLVNLRNSYPLGLPPQASGEAESPADAVRLGSIDALRLAAERLETRRSQGVAAMDAAARSMGVLVNALRPEDSSVYERVDALIAEGKRSLQNGDEQEALHYVNVALGALREAPALETPAVANLSIADYSGAVLLNTNGVRIGFIGQGEFDNTVTLHLGAQQAALGFIDLGPTRIINVPLDVLLLGESPKWGESTATLPDSFDHKESGSVATY